MSGYRGGSVNLAQRENHRNALEEKLVDTKFDQAFRSRANQCHDLRVALPSFCASRWLWAISGGD